MHHAHAVFSALQAASGLLAASSSSSKQQNSNGLITLLPLLLIFGVAYFFFLRPRAQAARRQRDTLMELSPGDEVLTGAGIFGRVVDVEDDRVTIETAPGTHITVLRSTIARRLNEPEPASTWGEADEDEAHGAYADYERGEYELDAGPDDDDAGEHDDADHAETESADHAETESADHAETESADHAETETADHAETETADHAETADETGTAERGDMRGTSTQGVQADDAESTKAVDDGTQAGRDGNGSGDATDPAKAGKRRRK